MAESVSSEDLEVQKPDRNQSMDYALLLHDTNYTKDTVAASAQISRVGTEKEGQENESGEKTTHVGFWHNDLTNVRLHVLKLWARTGKANQTVDSNLFIDCLLFH